MVTNHVKEFISDQTDGTHDVEGYALHHASFVTFTFDRLGIYARKRQAAYEASGFRSPELYNLNHFYNLFSRSLIGRDFMKEKYQSLLPFVFACVDIEGTRYGRSIDEIKNAHIHSLWVFRPGDRVRFEEFIDRWRSKRELQCFDFDQIDSQWVTNLASLSDSSTGLGTYLTKFVAMNTRDVRVQEDIQIWPRSRRGSKLH